MIEAFGRVFLAAIILLFPLLLPMKAFSAGAVKFRHVMSVYNDDKGIELKKPEGVACGDESLFIVADTGNSRLLRFTFWDKDLAMDAEINVPQLTNPIRVEVNSRGEIYALNGRDRRIVHLSREGEFKGYLEPVGLPSTSSYVPRGFDIDNNDNIYILDIFSERVLILNPDGEYKQQINFPENYGFFSDISVDFKNNIILIDSINAKAFTATLNSKSFSPFTESLKEHMRFPTSLTTDKRGRIFLVDQNGSRIVILGQDGSYLGQMSDMGWKDGLLNYPSQICINNKGNIFIADVNNQRVQIFSIIK